MEELGSREVVQPSPDPPRGVFKVSVDDKGRLKLPAAVLEYLQALGVIKLFITTLDIKEGRIYPLAAWKEAEKLLQAPGEDFELRQDVALIASAYGRDDQVDAQGRVTLPPELRKELGLEKDETRMRWYQGHLRVVSSQEHERRLDAAKSGLDGKLKELQKKGL